MEKGKLILIPTSLGEDSLDKSLLPALLNEINQLRYFIVENEKSARKFFKQAGISTPQNNLQIKEYAKHNRASFSEYLSPLLKGFNLGLLSEAGCPAIADPGAEIVREAHRHGIKVIPWVGANSIILGLMASGFNGQSFCFQGYLPVDKSLKKQKLKQMEAESARLNQTQIWIETPFRNRSHLNDLLIILNPLTELCIAAGLTTSDEFIQTKSIKDWKLRIPVLDKIPAVFLLYAFRG